MTTVEDLITRLASVDIAAETDTALDATDKVLVENVKNQLFAGQDASGSKLSPKYRLIRYANVKHEMNALPGYGTPDLKLTGALYREMNVHREKDELVFDSKMDYAPALEQKYGSGIFEPSNDNLDSYALDKFFPHLVTALEEKTGLDFK